MHHSRAPRAGLEREARCDEKGTEQKKHLPSSSRRRRLAFFFNLDLDPLLPPALSPLTVHLRALSLKRQNLKKNSYVYPPNGSSLKPFASSRSVGRDTAYIARSSLSPGRYDFLVTGSPEGRGKGKATVEFVTPRRRMNNDTAAALKGFLSTCCDVNNGEDHGSRPCSRLLEQPAPLADAPPLEIPDYCSMPGIICAR